MKKTLIKICSWYLEKHRMLELKHNYKIISYNTIYEIVEVEHKYDYGNGRTLKLRGKDVLNKINIANYNQNHAKSISDAVTKIMKEGGISERKVNNPYRDDNPS